ncbi:RecX family transcriptional regulator [Lichenicoccus sp.]|uniref:RecX family transcriptional regulator n=1 Tax=Lichenicoccus sp. TaxID=2781899 RepID=UPI003D121361
MLRVLTRRIARWTRQALDRGDEPDAVHDVARDARALAAIVAVEMVRKGAIDDAAFAAGRARALTRAGRSRRAVAAHLATRGVAADQIQAAILDLPDSAEATQLAAALVQARRRRIGPFRAGDAALTPIEQQRALAALARAGFDHDIAAAALACDPETAERLIAGLRSFL